MQCYELYTIRLMRARAGLREVTIISRIAAEYFELSKGAHTKDTAVGLFNRSTVPSADE